MTEFEQNRLLCRLSMLSVFRGILKTDTMICLVSFLNTKESETKRLTSYGEFVHSLSDDDFSFSDFLCRIIYTDENPLVVGVAQKEEISESLLKNAYADLELFSDLTQLTPDSLLGSLDYDGFVPQFENTYVDFAKTYTERLTNIERYGYGIFARGKMFRVENNEILPIEAVDEVTLDSFVGYEEPRQKVFDNTKALIDGKEAANVLLFGDAGTGKSSTVKACANYFYNSGIRLIEIRKDQLLSLSYFMGKIAKNPLKFIIFIDDLSFNKNDDCFSMLKAALEGSASAKAKNAVIYATSNRRHIVKETFSGRAASDDIHHNDTVQELMSLSDRFGMTVYFEKPDKALYLDIVHKLAEKKGILFYNELDTKAEAYALAKGSRSPRAAEQFVNTLI